MVSRAAAIGMGAFVWVIQHRLVSENLTLRLLASPAYLAAEVCTLPSDPAVRRSRRWVVGSRQSQDRLDLPFSTTRPLPTTY